MATSALLKAQAIAVVATLLFAGIGTAIILSVLKAVMGLRLPEQEERMGLDLSQHSESAYTFGNDYPMRLLPPWALSADKPKH